MILTGDVELVNLTNQTIYFYPAESVDLKTPVKQSDAILVTKRSIEVHSTGHAKVEISRVEMQNARIKGKNKSIPIGVGNYGVVSGIPEEKQNTIYIVSQLVYNAAHHTRKDIFMIDKPIRTESGQIIACRALSRPYYEENAKALMPAINYLTNLLPTVGTTRFDKLRGIIVSLNKFIEK